MNIQDTEFRREIEEVINKYSKESGSGTPDFILAEFLANCLKAYNIAVGDREAWYNRPLTKL